MDNKIYDKENPEIGKNIKPTPKPGQNVGIDITGEFYDALIDAGESAAIDISKFENFSSLSKNREVLYQVLDTMGEDSTISAMLETYTEDATEVNEEGDIVWAESSDPYIAKYVRFLLDSLNINNNIYSWTYSLIKYGDIYIKLYRDSDFKNELFKNENEPYNSEEIDDRTLNEDVKIKYYENKDKFSNYVEIVPNPGEMFELTKYGKTYAYIKTNEPATNTNKNQQLKNQTYTYTFNKKDIEVYQATEFVHGALIEEIQRTPEQVQLFIDGNDPDKVDSFTYTVRRGQSILYNAYKIWRQMMLLENSLILNRLTKSSILRIIEVEVPDMPKERVAPHLRRIKSLVEQKASLTVGDNMSEYTNPGAMENNIYVPTHNGVGAIQTQQVGGDVNVKDIADIDYFKNKFYAAMKIPKQFMGDTDDDTGFNGGTSLTIISSRYAKTIKRIQAVMCQCITNMINILLIDKGLNSYINNFSIHMQPPVTQEELDKRDNLSSKVQLTRDIMDLIDVIEDENIKLKILKSMLSGVITNSEVIELIQDYIDSKESDESSEDDFDDSEGTDDSFSDFGDFGGFDAGGGSNDFGGLDDFGETNEPAGVSETEPQNDTSGETLPKPSDLGNDFTEMV